MAEAYHVYECPNMILRRRFETGSRASRFDRELGLLAYQPKRRCFFFLGFRFERPRLLVRSVSLLESAFGCRVEKVG